MNFIYFLILVIITILLCHTELLGLHYVEPFKFKFWLFFFVFYLFILLKFVLEDLFHVGRST